MGSERQQRRRLRLALLLPLAAYGFFLWRHTSRAVRRIRQRGLREHGAKARDRTPRRSPPVSRPPGPSGFPRPGLHDARLPPGPPAGHDGAALSRGLSRARRGRGPDLRLAERAVSRQSRSRRCCAFFSSTRSGESSRSPLSGRRRRPLALAALAALRPLGPRAAERHRRRRSGRSASILFAVQARRHAAWAIAAGAAFGIAVLVRPADALLAVPLALRSAAVVPGSRAFALGLLPLAGARGRLQRRLLRGLLETGYDEERDISASSRSRISGRDSRTTAAGSSRRCPAVVPLAAVSILAIRRIRDGLARCFSPGSASSSSSTASTARTKRSGFSAICSRESRDCFSPPPSPGNRSRRGRRKARLPIAAGTATVLLVLGLEARTLADQRSARDRPLRVDLPECQPVRGASASAKERRHGGVRERRPGVLHGPLLSRAGTRSRPSPSEHCGRPSKRAAIGSSPCCFPMRRRS